MVIWRLRNRSGFAESFWFPRGHFGRECKQRILWRTVDWSDTRRASSREDPAARRGDVPTATRLDPRSARPTRRLRDVPTNHPDSEDPRLLARSYRASTATDLVRWIDFSWASFEASSALVECPQAVMACSTQASCAPLLLCSAAAR